MSHVPFHAPSSWLADSNLDTCYVVHVPDDWGFRILYTGFSKADAESIADYHEARTGRRPSINSSPIEEEGES